MVPHSRRQGQGGGQDLPAGGGQHERDLLSKPAVSTWNYGEQFQYRKYCDGDKYLVVGILLQQVRPATVERHGSQAEGKHLLPGERRDRRMSSAIHLIHQIGSEDDGLQQSIIPMKKKDKIYKESINFIVLAF